MGYRLRAGTIFLWAAMTGLALAEPVGQVFELSGQVTINGAAAAKGSPISESDKINTGAAPSFVQINFMDKSTVKLGPNSELVITTKSQKPKEMGLVRKQVRMVDTTVLDLNVGDALIEVKGFNKKTSSFEVRTPTAVAGVRGTLLGRSHALASGSNPANDSCSCLIGGPVHYFTRLIPNAVQRVVREGRRSTATGNQNCTRAERMNADQVNQEIDRVGGGIGGESEEEEGAGEGVGEEGLTVEDVQEEAGEEIIDSARDAAQQGAIEKVVEEQRQPERRDLPRPPAPPRNP